MKIVGLGEDFSGCEGARVVNPDVGIEDREAGMGFHFGNNPRSHRVAATGEQHRLMVERNHGIISAKQGAEAVDTASSVRLEVSTLKKHRPIRGCRADFETMSKPMIVNV